MDNPEKPLTRIALEIKLESIKRSMANAERQIADIKTAIDHMATRASDIQTQLNSLTKIEADRSGAEWKLVQ